MMNSSAAPGTGDHRARMAGVLLDMDGVLCDSEPFILEAATQLFRERYSVQVQPADFHPFIGAGEDRYLGGVAEKYAISLSMPADKDYTYAVYLQLIRGRLKPLNGVHAFCDRCRRLGIRLAVASSADRVKVQGNLAELGFEEGAFDAVISGDRVSRKKPDPEIFLKAAAELELPPTTCLVVEDAPNGIQAARSAGCPTLGLTSSFDAGTLRSVGAHWVAPDLAELPEDLLKCLEGGRR